ncbi:MAG: hypothetical protein IH944_02570 [Armatimonadetes bacterium]|nr:hypothetical protein [Armatimonadota bacterium]
MRKKRNFWWIVSEVGFVVLFTVVMLVMEGHSADAKMEATLSEVIDKYGFEHREEYEATHLIMSDGTRFYQAEVLSDAEFTDLVAMLRNSCQECMISSKAAEPPYGASDKLILNEDFKSIESIHVMQGAKTGLLFSSYASYIVVKPRYPSLWARIKDWWPW